jgi:hypothetical protein
MWAWLKHLLSGKDRKTLDLNKVWQTIDIHRRNASEEAYWHGVRAKQAGIDRNSSYRAFPEAQQRMLRLGWERGWDESSMALRSIREAAET